MDQKKNIVLIGFMGTGKTAVGIRLASRLGREFVDTDKEIEKVVGMPVREIFQKYGQTRFRSEESLVIKQVSARTGMVIATGGGAVINPDNVSNLKANGVLVCLQADPQIILERVNRKRRTRPLLRKGTTVEDISEMLEQRREYYEQADILIDTAGMEPEAVVGKIIESLKER